MIRIKSPQLYQLSYQPKPRGIGSELDSHAAGLGVGVCALYGTASSEAPGTYTTGCASSRSFDAAATALDALTPAVER